MNVHILEDNWKRNCLSFLTHNRRFCCTKVAVTRKLQLFRPANYEHFVRRPFHSEFCDNFYFSHSLQDVSKQLWSTLYDFPELQNCVELKEYMDECVRLSWMMAVQVPPMSIDYETTNFSDKLHGRFMTSDMKSTVIKYHVWPALVDSQSGHVLYRGTVVTWLKRTLGWFL